MEDDELEYDDKTDTWDMLAWIFIVLLVGASMGYSLRYIQEPIHYEQAEVDAMVGELTVVTRAEVCK